MGEEMFTQFKIASSDIAKVKKIGSGSSSIIYKGLLNKKEVAIKELENVAEWQDWFINEGNMMQFIAQLPIPSPYIIKFNGYIDNANCDLVMEYMPNGDLFEYISNSKNLDIFHLHQISLEVAYALQYLHSYKIIHRDIKLENVLMDKNGHVKLGDFGFATVKLDDEKFDHFCGTPQFVAPEIIIANDFSYKSDMYAFSILTYEIYFNRDPYPNESDEDIYKRVLANKRPPIPSTCPDEITKLIRFCWMHKPEDRYGATQAVEVLEKLKQFSPAKRFWAKQIEADKEVKVQEWREEASRTYYSRRR